MNNYFIAWPMGTVLKLAQWRKSHLGAGWGLALDGWVVTSTLGSTSGFHWVHYTHTQPAAAAHISKNDGSGVLASGISTVKGGTARLSKLWAWGSLLCSQPGYSLAPLGHHECSQCTSRGPEALLTLSLAIPLAGQCAQWRLHPQPLGRAVDPSYPTCMRHKLSGP